MWDCSTTCPCLHGRPTVGGGGGGGGLEQFSVSPRPFGFGFGAKGLGPGLDKIFVSIKYSRCMCVIKYLCCYFPHYSDMICII